MTDSVVEKLPGLAGQSFSATRQTAHEYVREVLRRAILNGDIPGGSRLVQAELATTLEVSTTPVREALRDRLRGADPVRPHRGAVVSELSGDELHEIYEIRRLLEPLAMRQAVPGISEALLDRLRNLHQQMEREPHSAQWVDETAPSTWRCTRRLPRPGWWRSSAGCRMPR